MCQNRLSTSGPDHTYTSNIVVICEIKVNIDEVEKHLEELGEESKEGVSDDWIPRCTTRWC